MLKLKHQNTARADKKGENNMAKKKSIDTTALIFIGVAVLGVILAIIGLCTPWLVQAKNEFAEGMFSDKLTTFQKLSDQGKLGFFPIGLTRAFGIIGLIVAIGATGLIVLQNLGIFKLEGLVKLIVAVAVVAIGALVFIFGISYVGSINAQLDGAPADFLYSMGVAMFLLPIGIMASGAAYLLNK